MGRPARTRKDLEDDYTNQLNANYEVQGSCWIWKGLMYANGYGRLSRYLPRTRFHQRAHIAMYQLTYGTIPAGVFVCHSCDVKACVNPAHLWLGTNQDNQRDFIDKYGVSNYWTPARRLARSLANTGSKNPMFGKTGAQAPCFGRTGTAHPMHGKKHSAVTLQKISASLKLRKGKKCQEEDQ